MTLGNWNKTADGLPPIGQLVAYVLKNAPEEPKIGFRDTPRDYCDRHPESDHFGWSLATWWTECADENESWEDKYVEYWYELPELPATQCSPQKDQL